METLLAPFYEIESLAPETYSGSDMSAFRLSAWTVNPDAIRRDFDLLLPVSDAVHHDADPARVLPPSPAAATASGAGR